VILKMLSHKINPATATSMTVTALGAATKSIRPINWLYSKRTMKAIWHLLTVGLQHFRAIIHIHIIPLHQVPYPVLTHQVLPHQVLPHQVLPTAPLPIKDAIP